jgi:hypothetical protein
MFKPGLASAATKVLWPSRLQRSWSDVTDALLAASSRQAGVLVLPLLTDGNRQSGYQR